MRTVYISGPLHTQSAGQSVARRFNQNAVREISASIMQAFFSRPATPDYLAHSHAARNCGDQPWPARYLGPHIPLSMGHNPDRELVEHFDEDLKRILAEPLTRAD